MKKNKKDKVEFVSGNFVLKDESCVFIWGSSDRTHVKIVDKNMLRPSDKFVYCDNCATGLAIQLDGRYKEKQHTFTLCVDCLNEFETVQF